MAEGYTLAYYFGALANGSPNKEFPPCFLGIRLLRNACFLATTIPFEIVAALKSFNTIMAAFFGCVCPSALMEVHDLLLQIAYRLQGISDGEYFHWRYKQSSIFDIDRKTDSTTNWERLMQVIIKCSDKQIPLNRHFNNNPNNIPLYFV